MEKPDFSNLVSLGVFPLESGGDYIAYAPLSDVCFKADKLEITKIECAAKNGSLGSLPEYAFISELISEANSFQFSKLAPRTLTGISILPTWNCNFNCSYCYAANAHKRKSIDIDMAYRAIDFFFKNMGEGDVALQILGGGEPFTEWPILRAISKFARKCEADYNRRLILSVATNGSILNESIIQDIKDLDIRLSFSFDILENIQNTQRSSYKTVSCNLKKLLEAGLSERIFIRTVITKGNVGCLMEIVEEVLEKYPDVCGVIAEPVMGMNNFDSLDDYSEFCSLFYKHFSSAREYALSRGLNFTTMALRNVDFSINYGCEGDFCVTPDGEISICHRLASPIKDGVEKYDVYGFADSEKVIVNASRYYDLIGKEVDSRLECKHCFAKYNCGGGCMARNLNETKLSKSVYCELFRKLLKDEIVRRFNSMQS